MPIKLDGRVVGGFAAWTPAEREIEDTDHSVLRILAGQTAAALQNCALLDHSARLHARTARQAADLKARNTELLATQAELGAARQREVLDDERHRIARELHDSVTQYALSAGMHIELVRSEIDDDRLRAQLDTAKDLTRRAVEQLRSAIYALNDEHAEGEDLPSMLRRLSGVHMPDELSVEVRIGGKPVALPAECEQSLFRIAGEALFNTAVHGEASRAVVRLAYSCRTVRLTISDDGVGRPEEVRRSLRAASAAAVRRAPRAGEHAGAGPRAGRHRWRSGRARLGGLQVQVEIPVRRMRRRTAPTRIVLVDDHSIMRQGLKAVLEREDDLRVVGEAGTPADAVAAVAASRPHVVLLDLKLTAGPQTDGLDVCRRLTAAHPGLGVLVLTTFAEDRLVVESVQAGARGYVVKDVDTTELVRAIRAVSRGESAFDARSASAMVRSLSGGVPERERLTERELDVLRLLARGPVQPRDRRRAVHLRDHREVPRGQPHAQADGVAASRGGVRGDEARTPVDPTHALLRGTPAAGGPAAARRRPGDRLGVPRRDVRAGGAEPHRPAPGACGRVDRRPGRRCATRSPGPRRRRRGSRSWATTWRRRSTSAPAPGDSLAAAGQRQAQLIDTVALWAAIGDRRRSRRCRSCSCGSSVRLRYARTAGSAVVARARDVDLLALRALAHQPTRQLLRVSGDPAAAWRRDDTGVVRELAALELRALGLRRPSRSVLREHVPDGQRRPAEQLSEGRVHGGELPGAARGEQA